MRLTTTESPPRSFSTLAKCGRAPARCSARYLWSITSGSSEGFTGWCGIDKLVRTALPADNPGWVPGRRPAVLLPVQEHDRPCADEYYERYRDQCGQQAQQHPPERDDHDGDEH